MIKTRLVDGKGTQESQRVGPYGDAYTMKLPFPPHGGPQTMRVFRQFLTSDGTSSGSSDMRVAASSASPSDFYLKAPAENDLYISTLSFVISDNLAALNNFGTLSALTNGCQLFYDDEKGQVTIHEALKSNFNYVRLCSGNPAFGDGTSAFRANNVSGSSEGYIPVLDVRRQFGFEWGIRLAAGSRQRITHRVRDDTTGVDAFNCIAYGFERLPD